MKKKIDCICDVNVNGDKKYKHFIDEAVDKFMDCMMTYYFRGYVESITLSVYFEEKMIKNE